MAYAIQYGPTFVSPKFKSIQKDKERFEEMVASVADAYPEQEWDQNHIYSKRYFPDIGNDISTTTGYRFPINEAPLQNVALTRPKKIKDFVCCSFGYAVSDEFIEVLENVDPGINRYLPFEFLDKTGSPLPERRSILNVTQRLDTIDVEASGDAVQGGRDQDHLVEGRRVQVGVAAGPAHLRLERVRIGGRAIWHEWRYVYRKIFISDEFYSALKDAKLTGWSIDKQIGWDGHMPEI